jgi:hypothetical protein
MATLECFFHPLLITVLGALIALSIVGLYKKWKRCRSTFKGHLENPKFQHEIFKRIKKLEKVRLDIVLDEQNAMCFEDGFEGTHYILSQDGKVCLLFENCDHVRFEKKPDEIFYKLAGKFNVQDVSLGKPNTQLLLTQR